MGSNKFNQSIYHKESHECVGGGICHSFFFPNGFGAKVLRNPWTGGYENNLWSIEVSYDGKTVYDTPVHRESPILGWLNDTNVEEILQKISDFPVKIRTFA